MATKVVMPRRGLSVESCLIQGWKKAEGDSVSKGEVICEVETNKAVFEIEAPDSGILLKILYQAGEDVPVLTTIAIIGQPEEKYNEALKEEKQKEKTAPPEGKPIKISPRAKKLARQKHLDPLPISGSGPQGRILERDVWQFLSEKQSYKQEHPATEAIRTPGREIPVNGIRSMIARRMHQSLQESAQLTLHAAFRATHLLEIRTRFKQLPENPDYSHININHLIMFGVIKALQAFPLMNSHYDHDRIVSFSSVHLGFAVDTPEGLKVPVVHDAQRYSLPEFARKVAQLSQKCFNKTILPEQLEGGTFTVTNLGNLGIEYFTPVLNLPQTGILGIGSKQIRPIIKEHSIEFAPYIGLSLTFDHRSVDGAPAARFLQWFIHFLEYFELNTGK